MDAVRGVCAFILDNPIWFLIPLALLNLLSFSLYGIDKLRAKRGMWRIPEATLLWSAALFGATGAFLGMSLFRHKTKHAVFIVVVTLSLVAQALVCAGVIFFGF